MGPLLHGSATTTEAVRRAIQAGQESVRALARRYGISPTTVQKWRKRSSISDAPMGPKQVRSTVLTLEEDDRFKPLCVQSLKVSLSMPAWERPSISGRVRGAALQLQPLFAAP
jgi:transposase